VILIVNFLILSPGFPRFPFGPRQRLQALPGWFRLVLIAACLAPLCLPLSLISIEGHAGFNIWYGYLAGGQLFYDVWGQIFVLVYEGAIVLPALLFASAMAAKEEWDLVFTFDALFAAGAWAGAFWYQLHAIGESAGEFFAFCSPLFLFAPIMLYGSIVGWRVVDGRGFFRPPRTDRSAAAKKLN
jgi:hypothetical protein